MESNAFWRPTEKCFQLGAGKYVSNPAAVQGYVQIPQ